MTSRIAGSCLLVLAACTPVSPPFPVGEDRPALESLATSCAWASACALEEASVGGCLRRAAGEGAWGPGGTVTRTRMNAVARCSEGAADCADFVRCEMGAEGFPTGPSCTERFVPTCDGDRVTTCVYTGTGAGGIQVVLDCAGDRYGGRCVDSASGARCDADCTAGPPSCEGDVMRRCDEASSEIEFLRHLDCGADGLACLAGIGCADRGPVPCTAAACDGPLLRRCLDGNTVTSDCRDGDPSFTCVDVDGQPGCGLPPASRACTPDAPGSESCDGTKARACVGGLQVTVDCAAVPGGSCEAEPGGGVRCVRAPSGS